MNSVFQNTQNYSDINFLAPAVGESLSGFLDTCYAQMGVYSHM